MSNYIDQFINRWPELGSFREQIEKSKLRIDLVNCSLLSLDFPEFAPVKLEIDKKLKQLDWDIKRKGVKSNPLFKAIGLSFGTQAQIVDATCGLMGDSIHLLSLGHRVWAYEREPVIYAYLKLCLEHANDQRIQNFDLSFTDISHVNSDELKDRIVLFDPMFEHDRKGAIRKEMRIFQSGVSYPNDDSAKTLKKVLMAKPAKVLVKRADNAPLLLENPHHQIKTKTIRIDTYYP